MSCAALLIPNGERKLLRTKLLVRIVNLWANPNVGILSGNILLFASFIARNLNQNCETADHHRWHYWPM